MFLRVKEVVATFLSKNNANYRPPYYIRCHSFFIQYYLGQKPFLVILLLIL